MICCNRELGELFVEKKGRWFISGKVGFHLYDTHGLPIEVTEYAINGILNRWVDEAEVIASAITQILRRVGK